MGVITFNGVASTSLGIQVETYPTYEVPEREYEVVHVPGRNGDVVINTGTFKNATNTYKVSMATFEQVQYYKKMNAVAEWLHSSSGYARLEDSYTSDFYTYAYFDKNLSIENLFNEAGRATLSFIRKPQRFLKTGDTAVSFTTSGTLTNPTGFASLPIINVTTDNTAGTFTIGNFTFLIKAAAGSLTVNSETQDVYSGTINKNSYVTLVNGTFPELLPGSNNISMTGGVTKLEIIPKWWTI